MQDHPVENCGFNAKRLDPERRVIPNLSENTDPIRLVVSQDPIEFFSPRHHVARKMTLRENECVNPVSHITLKGRSPAEDIVRRESPGGDLEAAILLKRPTFPTGQIGPKRRRAFPKQSSVPRGFRFERQRHRARQSKSFEATVLAVVISASNGIGKR